MSRRDAFTGWHNSKTDSGSDENQLTNTLKLPDQPLDLIPVAVFKKKRSRNWERAHQCETATYRGIPQFILDLIMDISQGLSVPRDDVVRAFLEYGVVQYHNGQLKLYAYPKAQRMTLFPKGNPINWIYPSNKSENQNWLTENFPIPEKKDSVSKTKKNNKDQDLTPGWERRVTFRIPSLLKEDVRTIARDHTLPVGEIVWFFILHGSKAFQDGNLPLNQLPRSLVRLYFRGDIYDFFTFLENKKSYFHPKNLVCVHVDMPQTLPQTLLQTLCPQEASRVVILASFGIIILYLEKAKNSPFFDIFEKDGFIDGGFHL